LEDKILKKFLLFLTVLGFSAVLPAAAQAVNAMSLNGITGLYTVPTAHLGWTDADLGFNGGAHMNFSSDMETIIQANVTLFNMLEIAGSYVIQPHDDDDDLLMGLKFALPIPGKTAIALGGNLQYGDFGNNCVDHTAGQVYAAFTYGASFFNLPTDATFVVGKSFREGDDIDSSIDFGMGFDVIIFPKHLNSFVHWLVDFSNFGYDQTPGNDMDIATFRATVNTGLRIDMSQIRPLSKFNFVVDLYLTDAFDSDRYFGTGVMFGAKVK
jgi:hypothetical protein